MDLVFTDMEKELTDKELIVPGCILRKGYEESHPSTASQPDEILSHKDEKDKKKQGSIMSGRNSLNTDVMGSVMSDDRKNKKVSRKEKRKEEAEFELDGGPLIEEGRMRVKDYLNTSGYASMMMSSDGGGSVFKGGPFAKLKGLD